MGTKQNPGRFDAMAKAEPDEPVFVLLGRDREAGNAIRLWAMRRQAEGEDGDVVMEALSVASDMDRFAIDYHARPKPPVIEE